MNSFTLEVLLSRISFSPAIAYIMLKILKILNRYFRDQNILSPFLEGHLLTVLQKPVSRKLPQRVEFGNRKIRVFVVVCEKDFALLGEVIRGVTICCKFFHITSIDLVVPTSSVNHELLLSVSRSDVRIRIIDENEVFDTAQVKSIFSNKFPGRENWCLQQFLKYFLVLGSETEFALVVDADTVLLRSIPWLQQGEKYVLMPTAEYQTQYYDVLIKLGVIDNWPRYSFVPHHMFYSVQKFKEMHLKIGSPSPIFFSQMVEKASDGGGSSPFCIDYELYAQFMFRFERESITLARWANCNLNRNQYFKLISIPGAARVLKFLFNSISLHSWTR